MKKLVTICLVVAWVVSLGCKRDQIIPELSPGRDKLLLAGLAVESITHLKRAEIDEKDKAEPRALLLIAYSHALSKNLAYLKSSNLETEYLNQRNARLKTLNADEIDEIFKVLNERHRVQKSAQQVLVYKGTPVIPLIIEDFLNKRHPNAHKGFEEILTQIGSDGLEQLLTAVNADETPKNVKRQLIRVIGDIGDPVIQEKLEASKKIINDKALLTEINVVLYRLGNKAYKNEIEAGLNSDNVLVRQAAARSMVLLNKPATSKLIEALKDTDDQVRRDIVIALREHVDANAVDNLVHILTNSSSGKTKQLAVNTLEYYAEKGLTDGLAPRLINLLTKTEITNHEDRIRIVQLMSTPVLVKEIEAADPFDNLPATIYNYYETKEKNDLVKSELNTLLNELPEGEQAE